MTNARMPKMSWENSVQNIPWRIDCLRQNREKWPQISSPMASCHISSYARGTRVLPFQSDGVQETHYSLRRPLFDICLGRLLRCLYFLVYKLYSPNSAVHWNDHRYPWGSVSSESTQTLCLTLEISQVSGHSHPTHSLHMHCPFFLNLMSCVYVYVCLFY